MGKAPEIADGPRDRTAQATAMLVLVTLLWGLSFAWMKNWQEAAQGAPGGPLLASLTLIALRMPLALLVLAAWRPRLLTAPTRREHAVGALIGVTFTAGFVLQVWGLNWTTPALSAFVTSLGSAWAPMLAWLCFGIRVARWTVLGLVVAVGGTVVLGLDPGVGWGLGPGEALTVVASLLFGVQIVLLDRLGKTVRAPHLSVAFFGVSGVLALGLAVGRAASGPGVGEWAQGTLDLLARPRPLLAMGLLILLPTVLSFYWMNTYQPHVSTGRAALIYLLEPVFAACFSIPFGLDALTWRLALGGALILAGNVLVEWRTLTRRSLPAVDAAAHPDCQPEGSGLR